MFVTIQSIYSGNLTAAVRNLVNYLGYILSRIYGRLQFGTLVKFGTLGRYYGQENSVLRFLFSRSSGFGLMYPTPLNFNITFELKFNWTELIH